MKHKLSNHEPYN